MLAELEIDQEQWIYGDIYVKHIQMGGFLLCNI